MSAEAFVPAEVVLDDLGRQVLPTHDDGSRYPLYPQCVRGCGYVVGVDMQVAGPSHQSCLLHFGLRHNVGTYPPRPVSVDGEGIVYPA